MSKSGFAGIVGRPNVGKSTLLNCIVGEKIAIATHKAQTTRNRITGILNAPEGQCVFIDTPGIHRPKNRLGRSMVSTAVTALSEADVVLFLIEAGRGPTDDDRLVLKSLVKQSSPVILVINKIDQVKKGDLLPYIDRVKELLPFRAIVPLSALGGFNVDVLLKELWELLPEGPPFFPDDMITEQSERFMAAEMIRELITLRTHQELPYTTAVSIDYFKEDEEKNLLRIGATILVAKKSQKGIIIGKNGAMLKQIGTGARLAMERFFGTRVFLELFVKVRKDWHEDDGALRELGYR
ncbi:MAG TPA: GTPase Era [Deltaproteobacteria bacterium]|nr:GTPase Era [Deltaproteobacteria bacterium]